MASSKYNYKYQQFIISDGSMSNHSDNTWADETSLVDREYSFYCKKRIQGLAVLSIFKRRASETLVLNFL